MQIRNLLLLLLLAVLSGALLALAEPGRGTGDPAPPPVPGEEEDGPAPPAPPEPAATPEKEPNDEPEQAADLGPGKIARATGTVSRTASADGLPAGDRDLFRLRAPAAGLLFAELSMPEGADFDLALLDAKGVRLATARRDNLRAGAGAKETLYAPVGKGEVRLVEVGGYAGKSGSYELTVVVAAAPVPAPEAEWKATATGDMAAPRCFHAAAALPDGRAIVGGGTGNAASGFEAFLGARADTEIFDPKTGKFSPGPDLGMPRFGPTATLLSDGRVLFAGGDVIGSAALFDPRTDRIVKSDIALANGSRILHTATLLPDGTVLLAGGVAIDLGASGNRRPLATTEIFDPKTLRFRKGPALLAPRYSHATCRLADGRVLVTGGVGRPDTDVVDVRGSPARALPGPALTRARDDHTATTLADGRVLVAGGQDPGGRGLDTAEILDDPAAPAKARFRALPGRLVLARSDHREFLLPDGRVLLLGGESDPGTDRDAILRAVEVFDPQTGKFTAFPPLLAGRDDARAVRLLDGRLLVTGGENERSAAIRSAEIYAPR